MCSRPKLKVLRSIRHVLLFQWTTAVSIHPLSSPKSSLSPYVCRKRYATAKQCSTVLTYEMLQIFGPVLTVLTFRTPKEAIALANNTKFGLAASVWTENAALGLEAAMSIKAGSCWVNCHNMFDAAASFGGYRESGFGRDGGKEVLTV